MVPVHYFDQRTAKRRAAQEARIAEQNRTLSQRARKRAAIVITLAAFVILAASLRAHRVLAAHTPNDMPANSRWILTGRDSHSFDKRGIWVGCWKSTIREVDHCRITDEKGYAQFDGDMLPLSANQGAVADKNLQLAAKINPGRIWVRGVNYDLPVPVLPLANGVQLVPISDREGLQKRLARGEWNDGLQPAFPAIAEQ